MVCGDVIWQYRQRAHVFKSFLANHAAFPIRRAADIGALWPPFVIRVGFYFGIPGEIKHRNIGASELLRLYARFHDGVDLIITWPDVFQGNRVAFLIVTQSVFLNIETDRTGDGIGYYQWR